MSDRIHDQDETEIEVTAGDAEMVRRESARQTRRSFVVGGAAAAAGYGLWHAISTGTEIGRQPVALRRTFQANAAVNRAVFNERALAPTYPLSRAEDLRLNGVIGMGNVLKPASWRLQVAGVADAAQHSSFARDITAWEYQYGPEMDVNGPTDVKAAPGNSGGAKTGNEAQKPGKDSGAPKEQRSQHAGNDSHRATQPQEPGAGAGSGQPVSDGSRAADHNLNNSTPVVNGLPHISIEERFNAMDRAIRHKRNIGDDEAGPSSSSLDIGTPGLLLTMDDLKQLPFVEHVTQFRCIEGWSQIVHWGGYRLRDFIDAYPPEKINGREPRFVYMETPDGNYYGGYDMSAARHPQSLLVTHLGGQPLSQEHGAPLRLFMPIKYGYKNLKRIGLIAYTETRPDDYWTKLGYDWYAGL